ncbi:prepilin-type N-terminal cleavage/methylation domain-containing protein [uncultured Clostridium sp.]|uniref:prepilin-type N-terminal cleavage/methylation domain-containing protein n=1 Tax=uncultured Clostridium sp. TaxID=59620 RepID=UPI0025F48406|nr:prepilin-type N-terminal cleavage/methylation domain-containing protein [uncultured Clostridium sp.]
MKKNSRKKKGFTLIEIIISICVIAIISIGVYGAYMLIIHTIKKGEEKQTAALIGKQTIESIKGSTDGKSLDIASGDGDITLNQISFNTNKDDDNVTFSDKTLYLDSQYEITGNQNDSRYTETITIEKAMAQDSEDDSIKTDISLDSKINNANKDEDGNIEEPVKETNVIKCNLNMVKNPGQSQDSYIEDDETKNQSNAIPLNYKDKVSIDVYIEANGNKKKVTVYDCKGAQLLGPIISEDRTAADKINRFEVHVNFSKYKKAADEQLKKIEVNVFNKDDTNDDNYAAVLVEKTTDLDVKCETREGKITFYNNRSGADETSRLGTLYDIKVEIKRNKDNEVLFTGYSNQNLVFN